MKELYEIPECNKLFDEMFAEWDKIPRRPGGKDLLHERKRFEIEAKYLPKLYATARKYDEEHPEENEEENKKEGKLK